jgi:hypothetical protein
MRGTVLFDATPFSSERPTFWKNILPPHLQSQGVSQARKQKKQMADLNLLGSCFNPEDGGNVLLRNAGLSPNNSVTTQNIALFIVTAIRTSNLTC